VTDASRLLDAWDNRGIRAVARLLLLELICYFNHFPMVLLGFTGEDEDT
jgi:hypothetical protein